MTVEVAVYAMQHDGVQSLLCRAMTAPLQVRRVLAFAAGACCRSLLQELAADLADTAVSGLLILSRPVDEQYQKMLGKTCKPILACMRHVHSCKDIEHCCIIKTPPKVHLGVALMSQSSSRGLCMVGWQAVLPQPS